MIDLDLCSPPTSIKNLTPLKAMKNFKKYVQIQQGKTIKWWHFDAGGEFKSSTVTSWLNSLGIVPKTSMPHQHQQNGHAECMICTIWDKLQTLQFTTCLPPSWWEFCIDHAVHLINHTPILENYIRGLQGHAAGL